ncbi:unnamed protein product [Paramecium sonneborni]|uniref:Uncharacterized protein n=1 Tax=Paramecium sonneborni TaxID=65129 RepID=A0A8S1PAX3_9CILI|nr:unnamed protein product [Paramecium sonneborni]
MLLKSGHLFKQIYIVQGYYSLDQQMDQFLFIQETLMKQIREYYILKQLILSTSIRHLLINLLAQTYKDRIDSIDALLNPPKLTQIGYQNQYRDIQ